MSNYNQSQNNHSQHERLWLELNETFQQDLPATINLLNTLKLERTALEQRDYDTFEKIIVDKQTLLNTLETNANARRSLLQQAGFTDESATLKAVEQEAPSVAKAWHQLGEQWKQCQQLNEVNERIAKRTRLVVGQLLDILRGHNSHSKLYNSKGDARRTSSGRTITSA